MNVLDKESDIGIIGLGVMGKNLLLNMSDHGFKTSGYDKDAEKVATLKRETVDRAIFSTNSLEEFISSLRTPRAILLLVPAGKIVDDVINEIVNYLEPGDIIIDAGNSYFKDTNARFAKLEKKQIHFLGVGVSGGERGARIGPSIMPGGPKKAYESVRTIFEAVAAKVDGKPCVAYLGSGSAGHYVKMVHNGIEYGVMQLLSESYDFMKRVLGFNNERLQQVYQAWNTSELQSYLMEITGEIFKKVDDKTGHLLIDEILDVAKQKGTGMWTTQSAMELQIPVPTIDAAVTMRDLSVFKDERKKLSGIYEFNNSQDKLDEEKILSDLQHALYIAINIVYAQGMSLLRAASAQYNYDLDLAMIARIWQGGCIIRASLLKDIKAAYESNQQLENLLMDQYLQKPIKDHEQSLRAIICTAIKHRVTVPGLSSALGYFDAFRSRELPDNLIQAQRDYFGAHTYQRVDEAGIFHTDWEN